MTDVAASSIVDAHAHVWKNDREFPWSPDAVSPPTTDAEPATLLRAMESESVAAAVLVQYIGYRWDNEYVARAIAAAPDRFAGVCRVDPEHAQAPDHLSYWTKERGFHGVRISPGRGAAGDWFSGSLMDPLFVCAADLGIPVVVLIEAGRLPDLISILDRHPDLDLVIDHFADCNIEDTQHMRCMERLARNSHVFLKTGHLWANSNEGFPWRDQHAVLRTMCDLFGASRIMWGSDWSLCLPRATYRQTLAFVRDEAPFLSATDLAWILGGTARRLWTFKIGEKGDGSVSHNGARSI